MHNFKKSFGQNFLKDDNILHKIISFVPLNQNILEIGPGDGALTKKLLKISNKVISVELDKDLENQLSLIKEKNLNFDYIMTDFLKLDLKEFEDNNFIIIANIPYNISTDIIFKFLNSRIKLAILMVQKEYAERVVATSGESQYSKLSVVSNFFCITKKLFDVKKTSFYPVPKVDSSIIYLEKKNELGLELESIEKFVNFIKNCFFAKRKTLLNNLNKCYNLSREKQEYIFNKLNINLQERAENISVEQFILLFKEIFKDERESI